VTKLIPSGWYTRLFSIETKHCSKDIGRTGYITHRDKYSLVFMFILQLNLIMTEPTHNN